MPMGNAMRSRAVGWSGRTRISFLGNPSNTSRAARWALPGTMEGSYRFTWDDGTPFTVAIGRFFLAPNTASLDRLDQAPV